MLNRQVKNDAKSPVPYVHLFMNKQDALHYPLCVFCCCCPSLCLFCCPSVCLLVCFFVSLVGRMAAEVGQTTYRAIGVPDQVHCRTVLVG